MTVNLTNKRADLPWLSIEAADELQRLKLKMPTNLENTKELSRIIKEDFNKRWDYITLFKQAYNLTYNENLPNSFKEIQKEYINGISNSLENPSSLEKELELDMLINFCVNLADYSAMHEEEINNLRISRYGRY